MRRGRRQRAVADADFPQKSGLGDKIRQQMLAIPLGMVRRDLRFRAARNGQ